MADHLPVLASLDDAEAERGVAGMAFEYRDARCPIFRPAEIGGDDRIAPHREQRRVIRGRRWPQDQAGRLDHAPSSRAANGA